MSETKHSPEPWRAVREDGADGPYGWHVKAGDPNGVAGFATEDNARRIVACVNACAGIPTDALEKGTLAEFLTHVQAMLILIRNGIPPDDTARVGRIMLSELGRHP